MLSPRWRKVLRDLWGNKTRTLLVVLSIAVGVFAIGTIVHTYIIVSQELGTSYAASSPASLSIFSDGFDDELVRTVRRMEGVREAEGRTTIVVRLKIGAEDWKPFLLFVIPDYTDIRINKVWPQYTHEPDPSVGAERTAWPPSDRTLLLERASLLMPGLVPARLKVGDVLTIESSDGKQREMRVAGLAHEPNRVPATFNGTAYGYINLETLEWLTGSRNMNEMSVIVAGNTRDKQHIAEVAGRVEDKVEKSGRTVYAQVIPDPGKRPFVDDIFQGMLLLLGVLGLLSLFLSGFLVVNTVSAILAQHVRQIGMMKAIGARANQILGMYLATVLVFGLLALVVAVPLAAVVAGQTSLLLAGFINVSFPATRIPSQVLVIEVVIGLIAPLLAALVPVIAGTRVTVREAISDYGLGKVRYRHSLPHRLLSRLSIYMAARRAIPNPKSRLRDLKSLLLPRPLLLSLRNTFRRKARLALTLATLVLGGTIFIAVFSVRASMLLTLDDIFTMYRFDAQVQFNSSYRAEALQQQALSVPGVVGAEAFDARTVRRLRPNGSESDNLVVFAPYAQTEMIQPAIVEGRWLLPEDENALVLDISVLKAEPDLKVGDEITLKIDGRETTWQLVGILTSVGSGVGMYANYPYFARLTGETGRASVMWITMESRAPALQVQVKKALEDAFKRAGLRVSSSTTNSEIRERNEFYFNIIVVLLAVMAVLMAIVGGLGLAGTMSINVLERTREIGVMRAIGASDGAVRGIVVVEGLLVGVLSWLVGAFLAFLVGKAMSDAVGIVFFRVPMSYTFATGGVLIWLVIVVVLSALASALPARHAIRQSVHQVLAYE